MNYIRGIFLVLAVTLLGVLFSSVYIIPEGYQAIVIQFGEVITPDPVGPGIHFKLPIIQKHIKIDKRILNLSSDSKEVIAADQKRVIVNYYVKYIIKDPVLFYSSARTILNLETRLKPIVESNMREQIGLVPLISLLTEERGNVVQNIKVNSDRQSNSFGTVIVDFQVMRTDLPEENTQSILQRMQTEREKEAKEIRAQGFEEAQKIQSDADKQRKVILSEAYKNAEIMKGEGDAEATAIYSKFYSTDEEFYKFYRTLIAYKTSFNKDNSRFILSGDDKFLSILKGEWK